MIADDPGETALTELLYERLRPLARRLAFIDKSDPDDLLQLGMVEIVKVLRSGKRSDIAYLYGTGKIAMLHELKQNRSDVFFISLEQYTRADDEGEPLREIAAPDPRVPVPTLNQRRHVWSLLSYLSQKQRVAIMAVFAIAKQADLPCTMADEVCEQLGLTQKQFQQHYRHGLFKLRHAEVLSY
jgi:DNA-directed RNA polymerase specialized sigma24 family protein